MTGKTKFKSLYEQTPYIAIDVKGTQYKLLSCDTRRPRQPIIRHASQIKPYQQPARTTPPYSKPAQAKPQHCDKAYALPNTTRRRKGQTNTTQNDPQAHSANDNHARDEIDDLPPPAEGPANEQPATHEIEPEITFCYPQQHISGEGRSKTGRPRKYGKNKRSPNYFMSTDH